MGTMLEHLHPYTHQPLIYQRLLRPTSSSISFLYIIIFFIAALATINPAVHAASNVTIDDGDGRIAYSPAGVWAKSAQTSLNYGGSHMLTQNPAAKATFNFTGTAIYFLSPLWPYLVNTAVSLDNAPTVLLDLVDHSKPDTGQGPETVGAQVVWGISGLENTQHTLTISVGAGQPFAIVDGLIYTDASSSTDQPSNTAIASPSTATGRILASATATPTHEASTSSASSKRSAVPIALGTLFGILGLLIIVGALWYFCHKRRRPISEAWTEGSYGHPGTPGYRNAHPGYGQNAAAYGHQLPPQAYGADGHYDYSRYPQYEYAQPPDDQSHGPSSYSGVPPNRAPNRYQPGYTLSTITEKSTPQMADGNRTIPGTPRSGAAAIGSYSPASQPSDVVYYTAPGSSAGHYSPPQANAGQYSPGQGQQQVQKPSRSSEKKGHQSGKLQIY